MCRCFPVGLLPKQPKFEESQNVLTLASFRTNCNSGIDPWHSAPYKVLGNIGIVNVEIKRFN